jgi:biotin-dependent carboxylase-like uncharacterized protein
MLEILSPGLLTTIQDLGRPGFRDMGVSGGGAADRDALRVANRLVGNADNAAGIEFTLVGPTLRTTKPILIALTGGDSEVYCGSQVLPNWRPIALASGVEISLGRITRGARGYLAISGGIDVPCVMGSRSTDLRSSIGGLRGTALRVGDRLPIARLKHPVGLSLRRACEEYGVAAWPAKWWVAPTEDLRGDVVWLHLLPGPDIGVLDPRVLRTLRDGTWTVSQESDRKGLHFEGPGVPRVPVPEQITSAVLPGTVQVQLDGKPILLGVDAQTVGGYPRIAQVIRADLGRTMQLRPGDQVRPVLVTQEAAETAWRARQQDLSRMQLAIHKKIADT